MYVDVDVSPGETFRDHTLVTLTDQLMSQCIVQLTCTCISRNATTEKFVTSEQSVNNTERWAGHLLQMSFVIPDRGPRRSLVVFPPVTKITEIIKYRTFIHINS